MTVENTNPIQHFTANGETTVFAISFAVEGKDNIKVTVNGSVVSVNDYSYDALSKSVVFNAAPEDGAEVVVERVTSLDRSINYQTYDNSFRPETLNYDLDRIWRVLQEQNIVDAEVLARLIDEIEWRKEHDEQVLANINNEADQRRLVDERIRDEIDQEAEERHATDVLIREEIAQEVQARRTLDLNYDTLAQVRDLQVFGALKDYLDTIIASTSPNVFGGVTAGIVFALDKKSVQTHLEDIYQKLVDERQALQAEEQRAINAEQALDQKIDAETDRAVAVENQIKASVVTETNRATTAEGILQTQINTLGVGNKAYVTYADMVADKANIAAQSKVTVTNDSDVAKNGDYQFNGTSFTKSTYDPLTQSKNYIDSNSLTTYEQHLLALTQDKTSENLFGDRTSQTGTYVQIINTVTKTGLTKLSCVCVVETDGILPSYNNTSAGSIGLKLETITSAGSVQNTKFLIRIGDTNTYYVKDAPINGADVAQIKIGCSKPSDATYVTVKNLFATDKSLPNPSIQTAKLAIKDGISSKYQAELLSLLDAKSANLLNKTEGTSTNIVQLRNDFITPIEKYSAVCVIETDGTYPTANSSSEGFRVRIELEYVKEDNTTGTARAGWLQRLGNSKVWLVEDANAAGITPYGVKISATKPADATYVTIKNAVITPHSFANPIHTLLVKATDSTAILEQVETITDTKAVQIKNDILNSIEESYPTTALEALGKAATRRVDLVCLGDSNHQHSGKGFDYAIRNALVSRFGMYATPPLAGGTFGAATGAPEALNKLALPSVKYNYIPEGETYSAAGANGISIDPQQHYRFDVTKKLRCYLSYGTFSTGTGSFKPGCRLGDSPWTAIKMYNSVSTNIGTETRTTLTFDIDADASRTKPLEFKYAVPQQTGITGPFISYFLRVEDPNAVSGICVSPLYSVGGQSLWDMARKMLDYSNEQLTAYFTEIRRLQLAKNQKPIVVVYINSGLNDRNETETSLGWRKDTKGDSAQAYLDNLEVVAKRITDIWQFNGWDERELFYLIIPSHPVSTPDDSELVAYRQAAYSFANNRSRVSFVDFNNVTNASEMANNDWYYDVATDHNHLKLAGYEALSSKIVALIK